MKKKCIPEGCCRTAQCIVVGHVGFKLGKVPALVDTGAQFSCIGSDVIEYLYLRGEHWLSLCSVTCLLADGRKGQVSNAAKFHVGLLSFSWNHEFKILNEDPFPVILGMDFLQRKQMKGGFMFQNVHLCLCTQSCGVIFPR